MMDNQSYELVQKHIPSNRVPFEKDRYNFYMVVETHHNGPQEESDEKLMSFIESSHKNIEVSPSNLLTIRTASWPETQPRLNRSGPRARKSPMPS